MVPIIRANDQFVWSSGSSVHVCNRAVPGSNPGGGVWSFAFAFQDLCLVPSIGMRLQLGYLK